MLMSFSQQVKSELLKIEYESTCCEKAMLYGMCIFGKTFSSYGVGIQTENKEIAVRYSKLVEKYCNIKCEVKTSPLGKSHTVMINDKSNCDKVLGFFGHESKGSLKINHSNFDLAVLFQTLIKIIIWNLRFLF